MRIACLVIPDEMKCNTGPIGICGVGARCMRRPIAKENGGTGFYFERNRIGLIRIATDMVVALQIARVF